MLMLLFMGDVYYRLCFSFFNSVEAQNSTINFKKFVNRQSFTCMKEDIVEEARDKSVIVTNSNAD